jgi:hypothetical protein
MAKVIAKSGSAWKVADIQDAVRESGLTDERDIAGVRTGQHPSYHRRRR